MIDRALHIPAMRDWDRRTFLQLAGSATVVSGAPAAGAAPPASNIVDLSATQLSAAIHARKLSCVELMTACLDRIGAVNPAVNAIVALQDRAGLLAQAGERDAMLARGQSMGPLHGFPHAVKDLQPVKGLPHSDGSAIFRNRIATSDGMMVGRLRNAGVIFIGKTNTPEFGLGSHTYNAVYGLTRNAWNQRRSAGGSSGGAAVALATRMVPLADGSDYGGSLRNPAGWNNVCGFRTSAGRVPNGSDQWIPSMGVVGPMGRSVADVGLLLSVIAGQDPAAPLSMDSPVAGFAGPLDGDVKGKRIGWLGDFGGNAPTEPQVLSICRTALARFAALGCSLDEAVPDYPIADAWKTFVALRGWQQGAGLLAHYRDPARRALLKPEAIGEVETGLKLSAYDITSLTAARSDWTRAFRKLFERFDFLVAPTAQLLPFDAAIDWPHSVAGQAMGSYHEWMKGCCLVSLSGCPALAFPAGFGPGNLPIGLQIIAPVHQERACLNLGAAYEAAGGWSQAPPPIVANR
ncbi:MAG: amidase [Sphingomicrobium sp.]